MVSRHVLSCIVYMYVSREGGRKSYILPYCLSVCVPVCLAVVVVGHTMVPWYVP